MPHPLETGTIRILTPDGSTAGTGFLVLKSLAGTCAHIVTSKGLQAHHVTVPDPLEWFRVIISKFYGNNLNLQVVESCDEPQYIIFASSDKNPQIICTPLSPKDIRKMKNNKHKRLLSYADRSPLVSMPQNIYAYECSVLNNGILFDLELSLAWKGLTGKNINTKDFLWFYFI